MRFRMSALLQTQSRDQPASEDVKGSACFSASASSLQAFGPGVHSAVEDNRVKRCHQQGGHRQIEDA